MVRLLVKTGRGSGTRVDFLLPAVSRDIMAGRIAEPSTLAIERSLRLLDARPRSQLHESTSTSGIDRASITWRGERVRFWAWTRPVSWRMCPPLGRPMTMPTNDGDYDDAASDFVNGPLCSL